MNILICNDDGIESNALHELVERLEQKHNILVVSPKENRSATAHSLTINNSIAVDEYFGFKKAKAYMISGTPADCVKIANHVFSDFKTDIVISGINKGHNIGVDIMYSGTVAICYEASYFNKVSFAFSAFSHGESDFALMSEYAEKIITKLYTYAKKGTIFNVNFPVGKIKGIKFSPLGDCVYIDEYVKTSDNTYMLKSIEKSDPNKACGDVKDVLDGYITITPILFNKTDYEMLDRVEDLWQKL